MNERVILSAGAGKTTTFSDTLRPPARDQRHSAHRI